MFWNVLKSWNQPWCHFCFFMRTWNSPSLQSKLLRCPVKNFTLICLHALIRLLCTQTFCSFVSFHVNSPEKKKSPKIPETMFYHLWWDWQVFNRMHYTSQVGLLRGFWGLSLAKPSWEPLPSVAPLRWAVPRPGHQTGVKLGAAVGDQGEVKRSGLLWWCWRLEQAADRRSSPGARRLQRGGMVSRAASV